LIVLALDCATEILGLCLKTNSATLSFSKKAGFMHAESLAPWIERLCRDAGIKPAEIELVVAGTGPGSFTGLRIALATAKGLALGASCSVVGVSTLDAQGWKFRNFHCAVVPVIDARKKRLYSAVYREGKRLTEYLDISEQELIAKLSALSEPQSGFLITGPYANRLCERLAQSDAQIPFTLDPEYCMIDPCCLLELGTELFKSDGDRADTLTPLYLRKSEAEIKQDRNRG
jgi:tRNA threonylcarbamoyladenosine biosynthesis protein TsaB